MHNSSTYLLIHRAKNHHSSPPTAFLSHPAYEYDICGAFSLLLSLFASFSLRILSRDTGQRYVRLEERVISADGRTALLKFRLRYFGKEKPSREHVVRGWKSSTPGGCHRAVVSAVMINFRGSSLLGMPLSILSGVRLCLEACVATDFRYGYCSIRIR